MSIRIRRYNERDLAELVLLFQETVHTVNARDYSLEQLQAWAPQEQMEARMEAWGRQLPGRIAYVAEVNGRLAGFGDLELPGRKRPGASAANGVASASDRRLLSISRREQRGGPTAYLDRLYVHRLRQGEGIATALLAVLEQEARQGGAAVVTTEASLTAEAFFRRRGYMVVQRQLVVRHGVELPNCVMSKCL
ncbi:acetyltransferase [Paenibacillus sp. J31TS4]|uniref:GNAT family N-acetyltransferase n=1 Tax=Paenibacillus sp. J31TS4 TaxID=2807195 RepID=UPI001B22473E|nr:GNAT family N-acetyltransferase [Paenibacillus sp. J31TS4]GIP37647.1 acetyltransferase [Paenibacillus sp. J31TS4]